MFALIAKYNADSDVFTLNADGFEFDVKAKHVQLTAEENEPGDAIGREIELTKTIKGAYTQALKVAAKNDEQNKNKAAELQTLIVAALQTRIDNAPNENFATNMRVELKQFESGNALAVLEKVQALDVDVKALCELIAIHDKNNKRDYIAIYAMQKIRKAMFALAQGVVSGFDKYTHSIVKNLAKLQALDTLNTQRAICSKIELDEMQQAQIVKQYHNCSPTTASTQASSTRMMLRALNVCHVRKGAKGDTISFTDSASAKAVQALYM